MTCMILLITTLLRSHFATNTVGPTADNLGDAMEHGVYRVTHYDLNEMTLENIAHLPGDTPDDDKRRVQIEHHLEDDIESLNDAEYYENRQD
eukprot:2484681-Amphidinium_carterae.1